MVILYDMTMAPGLFIYKQRPLYNNVLNLYFISNATTDKT